MAQAMSQKQLLKDIRRFASRGRSGRVELQDAWEALKQAYPDAVEEGREAEARGRIRAEARAELKSRLSRCKSHREAEAAYDEYLRRDPDDGHWVQEQRQYLENKRTQSNARHARRRLGAPLSQVVAQGEHGIWQLTPAPAWTLVIDETGKAFVPGEAGRAGRFVGVLLRDDALPPPLALHAADAPDAVLDSAFQRLLEHPTGVLGVRLNGLPETPGDRWLSGVLELVEWVVRLLPMDGPTTLGVVVERRGLHEPGDRWPAASAGILRGLAERDPRRAQCLTLRPVEIQGKGHPHLAYADLVAHTWGTTAKEGKARLKQSGLAPLLMGSDSTSARLLLDDLMSERPAPARWREAVDRPSGDESVYAEMLRKLGERTKGDETLWRSFLNETHRHLDGAVNLSWARQEIAWLARYRPAACELEPWLRFFWGVALLANADHHGQEQAELAVNLAELGQALMDEDARLVCLGDLYRAVARTNVYDFAGARALLLPWCDEPVRTIGRRLYGRVLSSLGQHAAFMGDLKNARALFEEALSHFDALSSASERARERRQTETYLCMVELDSDDVPTEAVLKRLTGLVGPLEVAARRLGTSSEEKYLHHLYLRAAVSPRMPSTLKRAYLAHRAQWAEGEDHPWALIELYRALLLSDEPDAARTHLERGIQVALAEDSGPVLQLIAATLSAIGDHFRWKMPDVPDLETLAEALPFAEPWLERLAEGARDPHTLLAAVLPFNFR